MSDSPQEPYQEAEQLIRRIFLNYTLSGRFLNPVGTLWHANADTWRREDNTLMLLANAEGMVKMFLESGFSPLPYAAHPSECEDRSSPFLWFCFDLDALSRPEYLEKLVDIADRAQAARNKLNIAHLAETAEGDRSYLCLFADARTRVMLKSLLNYYGIHATEMLRLDYSIDGKNQADNSHLQIRKSDTPEALKALYQEDILTPARIRELLPDDEEGISLCESLARAWYAEGLLDLGDIAAPLIEGGMDLPELARELGRGRSQGGISLN